MKKIIKKFWGVGLILMLLSTLFIAATPVSAAEPLNWEMVVTGPTGLFYGLSYGTDVIDYASNDGITMYAITRSYAATAVVSTTYVTAAPGAVGDTYTFTYVNEYGVAARTATVAVSLNATATTAATLTLQTGDSGISDVTSANSTRTAGTATAGAFQIKSGTTVLATFTYDTGCVDGVVSPGTDLLLQSTMGGAMWTNITTRLPALASLDYVAQAPDDANLVVVGTAAPAAGVGLAISTNGGSTFTSMGAISPGAVNALAIKGIAVSPVVTGGYRYVSACGQATGGGSALYFYNYGAGVGSWKNAVAGGFTGTGLAIPAAFATMDNIVAFQFSPNFPSDYMGVALSEDVGPASWGTLRLHILSFNGLGNWDTGISTGYPVTIKTAALVGDAFSVNKASLALLPDYDGGDESLRIAFVGASISGVAAGEDGGVWRCFDNAPAAKIFGSSVAGAGTGIASVAFDGTNLAAGTYDTNNVFRCADPLVTSPTFLGARSLKKIGIDTTAFNDKVNVKFVGETLYGSKMGTASALSKSKDYGNVWNDFTLLDSALTTIDDIYYSADGATWYIAAHDAVASSVYRLAPFVLQRVLCVAVTPDFMLRGISDANVIYAADEGGLILYYSADGGTTRWYQRSSVPAAITDLAVESKEVIYIGSGINVYKSSNSGFTWSTAINSKLSGANVVNTMVSLGENKLVIGGTTGGVVWTTDGGTTWFPALGVIPGGPIQVAATGLTTGSYVFAADESNNAVYRCLVDPSNFLGEFKTMFMPAATSGEVNIGLMLKSGVLYALSSDGSNSYINRTGAPTIPGDFSPIFWGTRYAEAGISFPTATNIASATALRLSDGAPGTIKLYGVGSFFGSATIWYFDDTLALGAPKLTGPADKTLVQIASPLTGVAQPVNFTWSRISKATGYNLFIALDSAFTRMISPPIAVPSTLDPVSSIQAGANFQPGTTYYWRVAASTPIGSGFSETRSFIVQPTAASVPTIASPANGGTIESTKPAFSWTPVSGCTMYQFQLSEGTAFAAPVYDTQAANAGVQLPLTVTLEQGKTYFWRVRALQPVQSDWSTIANFTVATPAPPPPAPTPPVVVQQMPAPIINIPAPPPATQITIPPPPAEKVINPTYIWAIIIIGAVLVIAVIVLIVRTRRSV